MKDGGEVGRDPRWEIRVRASALVVEVYYGLGWVSDGVDEVSRDHICKVSLGDHRSSISGRR